MASQFTRQMRARPADAPATKADVARIRKFLKGRPIPVRWVQEYARRGWLTGSGLHRFRGVATGPITLTAAGEKAVAEGGS